jgi:hypothetical protein
MPNLGKHGSEMLARIIPAAVGEVRQYDHGV